MIRDKVDYVFTKKRKESRAYLQRIIEVILFLSKQGLSFREHDESESSGNRGNFLELIEFRSEDLPDSSKEICKILKSR